MSGVLWARALLLGGWFVRAGDTGMAELMACCAVVFGLPMTDADAGDAADAEGAS